MKKIEIKIPDNLTPEKEILAIAKHLQQKSLSGNGKNKSILRIGDNIDVKDLQTQITITRVSTEKPIKLDNCNVCGCQYQKSKGLKYFTDYGGIRKERRVCSEACRQIVLDNFPGRTALHRKQLKPYIKFW